MDLFKDSIVGQIIYLTSGRKFLVHREEKLHFVVPEALAPAIEKRRISSNETPDPATLSDEERTVTASPSPRDDVSDATKYSNIVSWYGPDDPANPLNWSLRKRVFVTFCLCLLTFSIYIGSAIYTPGEAGLAREFGINSTVATLGLTLFVIGYGVGPLVLSPLSEIPSVGRNLPYLVTLGIFVILQIPTALVKNIGGFLVLRFLAGFFGSPPLATAGASIADMFPPKTRAYPIGIWGLSAVCGPVIGPLIGGFAAENLGWRWSIWPLLMLSGATFVFLLFALPETSAANILTRRSARLRRLTGNQDLRSEGELIQSGMTGKQIAMMTLVRPIELMFREPIVFLLNMYIALVYAILYVWFEAFPIVFDGVYHFSPGLQGVAFMGIFIGAVLACIGFCFYVRYFLEPLFERKGGMIDPEDRLPPAMLGSFFIPVCMFFFGWTATASIPWIVPIIGSSFFSIGTFLLFQSVLNYLPDCYPEYSASVLAGNDFFRSIVGGGFPLFARAMFKNLQKKNGPDTFPVAWGCTLLGCLSTIMIPLPFIFYRYGARIRRYSRFATSTQS